MLRLKDYFPLPPKIGTGPKHIGDKETYGERSRERDNFSLFLKRYLPQPPLHGSYYAPSAIPTRN